MEEGRTPVIEAGVRSLQGGTPMLVVKITRFRSDRLDPEPVLATADQELCREILALIRERLAREEGQDGRVSKLPVRNQTDD
jgi:hypothetical protein